jgi:hypothetical protein
MQCAVSAARYWARAGSIRKNAAKFVSSEFRSVTLGADYVEDAGGVCAVAGGGVAVGCGEVGEGGAESER